MTHRLFVAFRPPPDIRDRLIDIMGGVAGARWQSDAQLHLTLRFIGDVDHRALDDVALLLSGIRFAPFEVRLSGAGYFDTRGEGSPLWAGVAPVEPLAALHKKVDQAVQRAGLESEHRAYRPHITVARLNRVSAQERNDWVVRHTRLSSDPFAIDHVALYESRLGHGGAHYEELLRVDARG